MNRDKQIIKVSYIWIITNIVLVIFKAIVWFLSNSIAIILDALNNLSDVISSVVTIIWTKLSAKKPDKEHPYWHGRIEYFASVVIAVIILIAWLTAFKESIEKIIHPEETNYTIVTLSVVLVGVFVKIFLWRYVKNQWKKLNSGSLIASGTDAISDSVLSLSTFIAALISIFFNIWLEGYLWVIISIFIIKAAYEILKDTINEMIGIRADSELTQKLRSRIQNFDEVLWVYDLALHSYGPNKVIWTAHIQVRDDMTAKEIHRLTREIIVDVYNKLWILMTIWIYASNDSWEYGKIKNELMNIIKKHDKILQVHGFYVDETTKTVSFDIIFDFDEEEPEKILKEIKKEMKKKYPDYDYAAIIDTDISD